MSEVMQSLDQLTNIRQVSRLPRSVNTAAMLADTNATNTAQLLRQTISKLEGTIMELEAMAERLERDGPSAVESFKGLVTFEMRAFERVQSLALVDVGIRPEVID